MGANAVGMSIPPPATTESEARDRSTKKHIIFLSKRKIIPRGITIRRNKCQSFKKYLLLYISSRKTFLRESIYLNVSKCLV